MTMDVCKLLRSLFGLKFAHLDTEQIRAILEQEDVLEKKIIDMQFVKGVV